MRKLQKGEKAGYAIIFWRPSQQLIPSKAGMKEIYLHFYELSSFILFKCTCFTVARLNLRNVER